MFATVFFLFSPIFSRLLMRYVPGLQLTPPDLSRVPVDIALASFGAMLLAIALAWRQPKHARPWLITAALLGVQIVLFATMTSFEPWNELVRLFAAVPSELVFSVSLAAGGAISWVGWRSIPPRGVQVIQTRPAADA